MARGVFSGVPGWAQLFTPQNERLSVLQLFSRRQVGSFALEVASSCPLGLGWEPPGPGIGALGGLQGAVVGKGCGEEVAEPWQGHHTLSPGRMEALGWSPVAPRCCGGGEELLASVLPSLPPSLIPPSFPSVRPSLPPSLLGCPRRSGRSRLSLAPCQPFPTLPNPGSSPGCCCCCCPGSSCCNLPEPGKQDLAPDPPGNLGVAALAWGQQGCPQAPCCVSHPSSRAERVD